MSILKAQSVNKSFNRGGREFVAVQDASLEISEGSLTVISGRSGSGKSTLLNMLSGALRPSSGWVVINGKDIYTLKDSERSLLRGDILGLVPQGKSMVMSLSVTENVLLPLLIRGTVSDTDIERAKELLKRLKLTELKDALPAGLSGGEIRRAAIARALITSPKILLADEPTGDLDSESTEIVLEMFKEKAEEGTAVLLVTHDKDVMNIGDVLYTMDNGRITQGR